MKIWERKPDAKDYQAAHNYLSLLFDEADVRRLVKSLRACPTMEFQAKDILRASHTPMLPKNNAHVAADLKRIRKGRRLSPVLLIKGNAGRGVPLTIADGYHRICASWYWSEDAPVACCLAALPRNKR